MKKKNTRDYGKFPTVKRLNMEEGGPIYDAFGDVTEAHINRRGGLTEGPSPEERRKHYPGKVSGISCWSEDSTFNMPTEGYVPGRLLSGGLGGKKGGGGGGKMPNITINPPSGGGGGAPVGSSGSSQRGAKDPGSTAPPNPETYTTTDLSTEPPPREGTEDI